MNSLWSSKSNKTHPKANMCGDVALQKVLKSMATNRFTLQLTRSDKKKLLPELGGNIEILRDDVNKLLQNPIVSFLTILLTIHHKTEKNSKQNNGQRFRNRLYNFCFFLDFETRKSLGKISLSSYTKSFFYEAINYFPLIQAW